MNGEDSRVLISDWNRSYPTIDRGEGVYVYDRTGMRYLDGVGGFHVVSIGHGVSEISDAVAAQARKIAFVNNRHFTTEPEQRLARRIVELSPQGMVRVYFVSGGSEANEIALQIAHQYHVATGKSRKHRVVGLWHSYHGITVATISMGGHAAHRRRMEPYLLNFPHIPPPHCYHCPFGLQYPDCAIACAKELAHVVEREGPDTIAAFIAEPILGTTAGAVVPPAGYYEEIRSICDLYDVLFIADEVVTGFGRTGRNFGINHWTVSPDIITVSKSLGSGYAPIGAVIIHEKVWNVLQEATAGLSLRLTFSGNPLSCAAALAVQEYVARHRLVERCDSIGHYLKRRLVDLAMRTPVIGDVRGKGLLLGVEFVQNRDLRESFPRSVHFQERVVRAAFERGLILAGGTGTGTGESGDHVLITPPFVISESECDELVSVLEASVTQVANEVDRN